MKSDILSTATNWITVQNLHFAALDSGTYIFEQIFITFILKLRTHLSTHRSTSCHTTPKCYSTLVWAAQMTWGIRSKRAHVLRRPDPILISLSKWALFCSCSVWTAFLLFLFSWWLTGVFYVTRNKILFSFAHIGSATHVPHAHIFTVISRLAPHRTALIDTDLCVLKYIPGWNKCNKLCETYWTQTKWVQIAVLLIWRGKIGTLLSYHPLYCHSMLT